MQCELLARALKTKPEFQIVGTASHSRGVLRLLNEFEPGVAVISADLEDGSGIGLEVIAHVRAKNWRTRTVALLDRSDRQSVVEAFCMGARGVFFREQPYELFPKCLRTVLQGQVWVSTTEMNYLLEALTSHRALHLLDGNGNSMLTPRESEVAQLVTEGLSNREISVKLGLSVHTVKNYLFRIFDNTGVYNTAAPEIYTMSAKIRPVEHLEPI
jgi:DNA-binding NarL/FixJ family response regulator